MMKLAVLLVLSSLSVFVTDFNQTTNLIIGLFLVIVMVVLLIFKVFIAPLSESVFACNQIR